MKMEISETENHTNLRQNKYGSNCNNSYGGNGAYVWKHNHNGNKNGNGNLFLMAMKTLIIAMVVMVTNILSVEETNITNITEI